MDLKGRRKYGMNQGNGWKKASSQSSDRRDLLMAETALLTAAC